MNNDQLFDNIKEILVNDFNVEEDINLKSKFMEEIKLNSLELIMFISSIEEKFNIAFEDDEMLSIVNVEDLINIIKTKTAI